MTPTQETLLATPYIYALVAAPDFARSGVCFAATSAGLRRSDDGGATFRDAFASLTLSAPLPATSVALSPNFLHDTTVLAAVPGGIVVSQDGGNQWRTALLPEPAPFIAALALSPRFDEDGAAFAATVEDGVFITRDGGAHWEAWNIGLLDHGALCLAVSPAFGSDSTLFVGTESGVYTSTNGGRFWRETAFAPQSAPVLSIALSPAFESDGTLFAGTAANGLFVSHDRGEHWQRMPIGEGALNAIVVSPTFPAEAQLLALLDDALLVSRDGGATWSPCAPGVLAVAVAAPHGLQPGALLLVGLEGAQVGTVTLPETSDQ